MIKQKNLIIVAFFIIFVVGIILNNANFAYGAPPTNMPTPYLNESDMEAVNDAFSLDVCSPWQFNHEHGGIDFFPNGNYRAFRAVFDGTIESVDVLYNSAVNVYQVNVRIQYSGDPTYRAEYAFESWDPNDPPAQLGYISVEPGHTVSQGDIIGYLHTAVSNVGPHVHFGLYHNGDDLCPAPYFSSAAQTSILNLLHSVWPNAKMCYGIDEPIPTASISVDGNSSDWVGVPIAAYDFENDDFYDYYHDPMFYEGDDIEAIYIGQDGLDLFLRMDLYENVNTYFGNAPSPNEGRYSFYLENNGLYPHLYISLAYNPFVGWSLGYNGSNGDAPSSLEGPLYVGVLGQVIEVKVPLTLIGNPTIFYRIKGEVVNCCLLSGWTTLDETHCLSNQVVEYGSNYPPPAEAINTMKISVVDYDLPEETTDSLISKLDSVLISVEEENQIACTNKLNSFINYVNVQKTKNIDAVKADSLIGAAQRIIEHIE